MENVKDIAKIVIPDKYVLLKLVIKDKTKSGVILPESAKDKIPMTGVVFIVGSGVNDLSSGDVVLDIATSQLKSFDYKGDKFSLVHRDLILIVSPKENYEFTATI